MFLSLTPLTSSLSAVLLACTFVGSLYVWKQKPDEPRDHPTTIVKRFISVSVASILSLIYFYFLVDKEKHPEISFGRLIGVHSDGFIYAATIPLILTMIWFLGPLVMWVFDWLEGDFVLDLSKAPSRIAIRNFFVGPLLEEIVFRACLCPILLAGGYGHVTTMFVSPLLFGLAHMHHIIQHLHKSGKDLKDAWVSVFFQLFYTTIFGAYSAYLFLRTGHLVAPFLCHVFCNVMGFPPIDKLGLYPQKVMIMISFVVGLLIFLSLLSTVINPVFFNSIFYQVY
eukprot:TRINITY_DN1589_c0_g1_i1.p1 TRINITY_DN1589_c0_g1~~TRINITY_DN1589_c0_g1_i1.p1  ORF type:complete len:282 (+),score=25.33 TRINITY_DN1589_c0_g1_i1:656-1501(+)